MASEMYQPISLHSFSYTGMYAAGVITLTAGDSILRDLPEQTLQIGVTVRSSFDVANSTDGNRSFHLWQQKRT